MTELTIDKINKVHGGVTERMQARIDADIHREDQDGSSTDSFGNLESVNGWGVPIIRVY